MTYNQLRNLATTMALPVLLALTPISAGATSNAAQYLIDQQIREGCSSGRGTIAASAVVERDLTGDGRADLILDHGGINCQGGFGRSEFCGAQACSLLIYVRQGNLLTLKSEILSVGFTLGQGNRPVIHLVGHGGRRTSLRWNGSDFR